MRVLCTDGPRMATACGLNGWTPSPKPSSRPAAAPASPCSDGQNVVEAVNEETDETFVVRGEDLYLVVVELAQQCGIELEDG